MHSHHSGFQIHDIFTRELFELYFLLFMKKLVLSMVGIFLPLYLLVEIGYSLPIVIYFFLAMTLSFSIFCFLGVHLVNKIGAKHTMILGIGIMFVALLASMGIKFYSWLFYPAAILLGAEYSFFWIGFHIDAIVHGKKSVVGKKSAMVNIMGILPSVIGPLIGGLIIGFSGFVLLFIIAIILGLGAVVPLVFSRETYARRSFSYKEMFRKDHLNFFLVYFAQGVKASTRAVFWPIFIFAILGGYVSMGVYGTVATFLTSLFALYVGKVSDEGKKTFMTRLMGTFGAIIWIFNLFIVKVWQVFLLGTLGGFGLVGTNIPILAKSYNAAKKEHVPEFVLFRELSIRVGQFFVLLLVLATANLKASFVASAVVAILYFFI
jgi:MFS family permease